MRERALFIPDSLPRRVTAGINWLSGGGEGAFTEEVRAGLKEAAGIYEQIVRSRIAAVRQEAKTYADSADVNALGESYLAGLPTKQQTKPDAKFKAPNGEVRTYEQLKSIPNWNDNLLNSMTPVE